MATEPTHTFVLNGAQVSVPAPDDLRLLWVLRDLLGVTGPKYGCGQPGQIMAAVAKVREARAAGHEITDADIDEIRNVCRCGTYFRIREAIKAGAAKM